MPNKYSNVDNLMKKLIKYINNPPKSAKNMFLQDLAIIR